jgi:hypothetical protein
MIVWPGANAELISRSKPGIGTSQQLGPLAGQQPVLTGNNNDLTFAGRL